MYNRVLVFFLFLSTLIGTTGLGSTATRVFYWEMLGGDPRDPRGLHSRSEYSNWFWSKGGSNDRTRIGVKKLPGLEQHMQLLVQQQRWGQRIDFGDGWSGLLIEAKVGHGERYQALTFNRDGRIEGTPISADGEYVGVEVQTAWRNKQFERVYRLDLRDSRGLKWRMDTFQTCANAGLIQTLFKPVAPEEIPEQPVPTQIPEKPTFQPLSYTPVQFQYRTVSSYTQNGAFAALANMAAQWLGRPVTNIAFGPSANVSSGSASSSSSGSSATAFTAPINVSSNNSNTNTANGQAMVVAPINLGANTANGTLNGAASGSGSQNINP